MQQISEATKLQQNHVRWGIYSVITLIFYAIIGGNLISKVVGFLYPAFESLKALESEAGSDDKKWLTYWIVFAVFIISEQIFAPIILIIPFYYFLKIGLFVYMFLPETNGAMVIFERIIRPLFLKNKARIDAAVSKAKDKAGEFLNKAKGD